MNLKMTFEKSLCNKTLYDIGKSGFIKTFYKNLKNHVKKLIFIPKKI